MKNGKRLLKFVGKKAKQRLDLEKTAVKGAIKKKFEMEPKGSVLLASGKFLRKQIKKKPATVKHSISEPWTISGKKPEWGW